MSSHVFISYSHRDAQYVGQLKLHLQSAGLQLWTDEGIDYGARWADVIERQIEDCAAFVPVMSPSSRSAAWVDRETDLAQELGKEILPLLLDGRRFLRLRDLQDEDVTGGRMPTARFVDRLLFLTGIRVSEQRPEPDPQPRIRVRVADSPTGGTVAPGKARIGDPVNALVHELSIAFSRPDEAIAIVVALGAPRHGLPAWTDAFTWWYKVVRMLQSRSFGEDGMRLLVEKAYLAYPGNPVFHSVAQIWRGDAPQPGSGPYHVLELSGSEQYAEMFTAVREWDPTADLLWGQFGRLAVLLRRPGLDVRMITRLLTIHLGVNVEGSIYEYDFPPYLLDSIAVQGPDHTTFSLDSVPNTTLVSDVTHAVIAQYAHPDRPRRLRAVAEIVLSDGESRRLRPGQTLHAAGVTNGARLRVTVEAPSAREIPNPKYQRPT